MEPRCLLNLPSELRIMIYEQLFNLQSTTQPSKDGTVFNVLRVNRQLRCEISEVLLGMKLIIVRFADDVIPPCLFEQVPKLLDAPMHHLKPFITIEMFWEDTLLSPWHVTSRKLAGKCFVTTYDGLADLVSCMWLMPKRVDQHPSVAGFRMCLGPGNLEAQRQTLNYLRPRIPGFPRMAISGNPECAGQVALANEFQSARLGAVPGFPSMITQMMNFWVGEAKKSCGMELWDLAASEYNKALIIYEALSTYPLLHARGRTITKMLQDKALGSSFVMTLIALATVYLRAGKAIEAIDTAQEALLKTDFQLPKGNALCKLMIARAWLLEGNFYQCLDTLDEAAEALKMHDGVWDQDLALFVEVMRSLHRGPGSEQWCALVVDAQRKFPQKTAIKMQERVRAFAELPQFEDGED